MIIQALLMCLSIVVLRLLNRSNMEMVAGPLLLAGMINAPHVMKEPFDASTISPGD